MSTITQTLQARRMFQMTHTGAYIWVIDLDAPRHQIDRYLSIVSRAELKQAGTMVNPHDVQRRIIGFGVRRIILGGYLGMKPADIALTANAYGKPSVSNAIEPIAFNMSHSDNLAILAITPAQTIGVDIEALRVDIDFTATVQTFFSTTEQTAFTGIYPEDRLPIFYNLWTRKEALTKAVGLGMSMEFNSFSISMTTTPEVVALPDERFSSLRVTSLPVQNGFASALAIPEQISEISLYHFGSLAIQTLSL